MRTKLHPHARHWCYRRRAALLVIVTLAAMPQAAAQPDEDVFELPAFVVDATGDRGYQATNTVSGTSLNMAIRDLPMSLEAITAQFLEDTGATTFEESLAYSSGVFTQQFTERTATGLDGRNSPGANQAFSNDRSPSSRAGVGGRFSNAIIVRGFNVPFQNLDGFRYGGMIATYGITLGGILDTVNVDRLEVVRGPNSLLYGVGVLSGIVNVIPRRPQSEPRQRISVGVGDYGYRRATLEAFGPLKRDFFGGSLEYRVAAAFEKRDHWTDFQSKDHEYYVGQIQFRRPRLLVLAEVQYADTKFSGIGDQHIYDNLNAAIDQERRNEFGEQVSWTKDVGGLPQSFRITGPDTYHNRRELNLRGNIDYTPVENLTVSVGGFYTWAEEERFDVNIATITREEREFNITNLINNVLANPGTPEAEKQRIENFLDTYVTAFAPPQDFVDSLPPTDLRDLNDYKTVRYWWSRRPLETRTEQFRIRAVYTLETPFFFGSTANHTFLAGRHDIKDTADFVTGPERINNQFDRTREFEDINPLQFRRIDDYEPIRYNGEPIAQAGRDFRRIEQWFTGHYGLYQGRFFNDRATLITGLRHDRYISFDQQYRRVNQLEGGLDLSSGITGVGLIVNPDNKTDGFIAERSFWGPTGEEAETEVTGMIALGYEVNRALSVYGLIAEGVTPNTGLRDGNYEGIESEKGTSHEIGIKVDLLDGRISGTVGAYRIRRKNAVWEWRRAPAPARWFGSGTPIEGDSTRGFDPTAYSGQGGDFPISYAMDSSYFPFTVGPVTVIDPDTGRRQQRLPEGVVFRDGWFSSDPYPQQLIYLDYDKIDTEAVDADGNPQGHTWRHYLEQAFADVGRERKDFRTQGGPDDIDPIVYERNLSGFGMNPSVGQATGANVTYTDEAKGVDFQLIIRPLPQWQLILNYAYTTREAVSPFDLPSTRGFGTEYDVWVRTFGREAFGLQEWDTTGDGVPNYITRKGAVGENPTEAELQAAQVGLGDVDGADMIGGLQGTSLFFGSEHEFSFWNRYEFTDIPALENVVVGFGGNYTGPAATSVAIGGNELAANQFRTPSTAGRWNFDAMVQYNFELWGGAWNARLNVYNLFDSRYKQNVVSYDDDGTEVLRRTETWRAPRSFRITLSALF